MSERYQVDIDPTSTNSPHAAAIRMVGSGRRVLEVGCSVGFVTRHLVANGNDVTGIEIDPDAAALAEQFATAVHVADLDLTPLDEIVDGRFDVIVFGDVLEHLRDPSATVAAAGHLLDDEGHLVVSVPNAAHIDVRLMLLEGRWEYQDHGLLDATHLRFFTREGLRSLLSENGFVATAIERVTCPAFGTNLGVNADLYGDAIIDFVSADDEALTFQFVVTAERNGADVLERVLGTPPRIGDHDSAAVTEIATLTSMLAERERHEAALVAELDAWRNSTLARISRPLRAVWAPVARRIRR